MTSRLSDRHRVGLVVLSGHGNVALDRLASLMPEVEVFEIPKARLEPREALASISVLRKERLDSIAIFCLSNRWQRRRAPLLALAAAGGASRVLLFSEDGDAEWFSTGRIVLRELPRTFLEFLLAPLLFALDWIVTRLLLAWWSVSPPSQALVSQQGSLKWLFMRQTPASGPLESGASTHVRGLLEGLDDAGESVHVLSNDRLPVMKDGVRMGINIAPPVTFFNAFIMASERWANLVWLGRAWREIGRVRPDAVYHRNARSAWASVVACWLRGVPVLLEYNVPESIAAKHWNKVASLSSVKRAERVSLRGATRVGAVSAELAPLAVSHGARADRVFENPNGVDVDRFATAEAEASGSELRRSFGLDDSIVVGFVGTFLPYHGIETLCGAIELLDEVPQLRFLMLGDGGLRPASEKRLARYVVDGRVTFTNRIGFERLPAYLAAFDICLAPYVSVPEGTPFINSPIKLFEYMAARRAIVASRLGQIERLLDDGVSGLLVPAGDAAALAKAIKRAAGDAELRGSLAREARKVAETSYTWRANAERAIEAVTVRGTT